MDNKPNLHRQLQELRNLPPFQALEARLRASQVRWALERGRFLPGSPEDLELYHKVNAVDALFKEMNTVKDLNL